MGICGAVPLSGRCTRVAATPLTSSTVGIFCIPYKVEKQNLRVERNHDDSDLDVHARKQSLSKNGCYIKFTIHTSLAERFRRTSVPNVP